MEVYADASCTTRPIQGEEYTTIYLKVNKDVDFSDGTITVGTQPNDINFERGSTNYIVAYIDFTSEDLSSASVSAGSVVALSNTDGATMAGNIFSFDLPDVPPVVLHDFEIWADDACTIRPVTGEEYENLYLKFNIAWEGDSVILGDSPNNLRFQKGANLTASFWSETLDSPYRFVVTVYGDIVPGTVATLVYDDRDVSPLGATIFDFDLPVEQKNEKSKPGEEYKPNGDTPLVPGGGGGPGDDTPDWT